MTATYAADHAVFSGPGQQGATRLTEAQRTNLATAFTLTIDEITLPAVGPVTAGASTTFQTPIAPREAVIRLRKSDGRKVPPTSDKPAEPAGPAAGAGQQTA